MKMTVEDINRVDELHDDIDDLLEGEDFSVCLHALCAGIAGAGVNVKLKHNASKQEFMASVHESISSWYDYYQDVLKGEQND
jgi:transcription elongation factor GreA-like protein